MEQCISCLSAKEGCTRLFLADISEGSLAQTRGMIEKQNPDAKVVTHVVKIAKEPTVIDMVAACVKAFGRLDCAVNCAGIARGSTKTTDLSLETFDVLCSVNEKGVSLSPKSEDH